MSEHETYKLSMSPLSIESEMSEAGRCEGVSANLTHRCSHETGHPLDIHCSHDTLDEETGMPGGCMVFTVAEKPRLEERCALFDAEVQEGHQKFLEEQNAKERK